MSRFKVTRDAADHLWVSSSCELPRQRGFMAALLCFWPKGCLSGDKIYLNHFAKNQANLLAVFVRRWMKELENLVNRPCPLLQPSSFIEIAKNTVRMLLASWGSSTVTDWRLFLGRIPCTPWLDAGRLLEMSHVTRCQCVAIETLFGMKKLWVRLGLDPARKSTFELNTCRFIVKYAFRD